MFLIEYSKGCFLNTEKLLTVTTNKDGNVTFILDNDLEIYTVSKELESTFISKLLLLNNSLCTIKIYYNNVGTKKC